MSNPRQPTISLCMIVRDEERWIARCISSVKSLVSEIIVVDTGSRDCSAEIAAALGARILHIPWCDDFSAARNAGIKEASEDWVLVMDADETIAAEDLPTIRTLIANPCTCYEFVQRHYTENAQVQGFLVPDGRYPEWGRGYPGFFETSCVRLFPNHKSIEFRGRVHELVEPSVKEIATLRIVKSSIRLQHYGHTKEVRATKNKSEFYSHLAEVKAKESKRDWRALFELGIEQIGTGDLKGSVHSLENSARLKSDFVLTWVNLGYALGELAQYGQAHRALLRAIQLDKRCAEAYCNLGVVYLRTGQVEGAVESFTLALDCKPDYVVAYCNLGRCLLVLGKIREAGACLTRALELHPVNIDAMTELARVYLLAGIPSEARRLSSAALKLCPDNPQILYVLGQALRCEGQIPEALIYLQRSVTVLENGTGAGDPTLLQGIKGDLAALQELVGVPPR